MAVTFVDVSRTIYAGIPKIPILPEVEFHPLLGIADGAPLNISELKMATHIGMLEGAPWHFVPEGETRSDLPRADLGPCRRCLGHPQGGRDYSRRRRRGLRRFGATMGRFLVLGLIVGAGVMLARAAARHEWRELARDLSDQLVLLVLRMTSGFANDVSQPTQQEERERRLRWR